MVEHESGPCFMVAAIAPASRACATARERLSSSEEFPSLWQVIGGLKLATCKKRGFEVGGVCVCVCVRVCVRACVRSSAKLTSS